MVTKLCEFLFDAQPEHLQRCAMGIGNYVYKITCCKDYILRYSPEPDAYKNTVYWLERLRDIQIPVPQVIKYGTFQGYSYLLLPFIEGEDIGIVYPRLTDPQKRKIAKEIVRIQERVAGLKLEISESWSWHSFVREMLDRAEERILRNGHFDTEKVVRLRQAAIHLHDYFSNVTPTAYLDDISSKNLLIQDGEISGIIDVDWMGVGDRLTYVALTNMALLDMECDTDYVEYILKEMQLNTEQKKAFHFYTLLYCVDFMGERGTEFNGKRVAVSPRIIEKLNRIYDRLWEQWHKL